MATAIGSLFVTLSARTGELTKGLRHAQHQISGFRATATKAFTTAALIAGPAMAVTGIKRLLTTSEDFNQAMTNSLAIMSGVTAKTRADMEATAMRVAAATKFSAKEAAEAYFYLASAGLTTAQSIAALPNVAKFAQAGNFDLALATDLLTDAQSALGMTVSDTAENMQNMQHVGDVLVKANTLANATVEQFSESLTTKAGAAMRRYGIDVAEGVAVLAAFADQGIKGREAGTAFNIVIRDLTTKALRNKEAFKAARIAVFDEAGELRNIADIVSDLERRLGSMSDAQKKATLLQLGFTDRSIAFIGAVLGTSEKIREYEKGLRAAGSTTDKVAAKQLTAFAAAMNRMRAAWEKFAIKVGTPILEGFAKLLDGVILPAFQVLGAWIEKIVTFFRRWKGAILTVVAALGIIRAAMLAVVAVQTVQAAITAFITALRGGWVAIAAAAVAASTTVVTFGKLYSDMQAAAEKSGASTEKIVGAISKLSTETEKTQATFAGKTPPTTVIQTSAQNAQKAVGHLGESIEGLKDTVPAIDSVASGMDRLSAATMITAERFSEHTTALETQFSEANKLFSSILLSQNKYMARQKEIAEMSAGLGPGIRELALTNLLGDAFRSTVVPMKEQLDKLYQLRDAFRGLEGAPGIVGAAARRNVSAIEQVIATQWRFHKVARASEDAFVAGRITAVEHEQNLTAASRELATVINKQVDAFDNLDINIRQTIASLGGIEAAVNEANRIVESIKTPQEKLAESEAKITALRDLGLLTPSQQMRAMAAAAEEFDRAIGGPQARIEELETEVFNLTRGLTEGQAELERFANIEGVTPEQLRRMEELIRRRDLLTKAAEITEAVQTPFEKMRADIEALQKIKAKGPITDETYFRRIAQLAGNLEELNKLRDIGAITETEFAEARRRLELFGKTAEETMIAQREPPTELKAVQAGTAEAFSAINRYFRQFRTAETPIALAKKQVDETKKLGEKIEENTAAINNIPENFAVVNLTGT